jgi:SAM-dependent methyltransferase/ADP-heptose:LPS heptosyltransferase
MKKILFVSWHGLGDTVLLTPVFRKYKTLHPDHYIAIACMKRYGHIITKLLSGLQFVDEIVSCLSDAWNDFKDYPTGVQEVIKEAKEIAEYNKFDEVIILPCTRPDKKDIFLHKIHRFANEVGIVLDTVDDLQTELTVNKDVEVKALEYLKQYKKPVLVFHTTAGNSLKTLPETVCKDVIDKFTDYEVLEIGRKSTERSILIPEDDMEFTKALVKNASLVVAIDSVVMHIAGALKKNLVAIFSHTPVSQAVPLTYPINVVGLDNEITEISKWKNEYCTEIYKLYVSDVEKTLEGSYHPIPFYGFPEKGVRGSGCIKRWKFIEEHFNTDKKLNVLDIGCNLGFFTFLVGYCGHNVLGIDSDKLLIDCATKISNAGIGKDNIKFEHIDGNLLEYLKSVKDDTYDYVLYMSVHHHIYEQFSAEVADQILNEVSRISKNMIFDMGQYDEKDNSWLPWLKLIPKLKKIETIDYVANKTKFKHGLVISSTLIHETERWLYLFSKEELNKLPKTITFDGIEYNVVNYLLKHKNKQQGVHVFTGTFDVSNTTEEVPKLTDDYESKVRYYIVRNNNDDRYFVKELFYDSFTQKLPKNTVRIEYENGQKLYNDEDIRPHIIPAIAIENNTLLFEYCHWTSLLDVEFNSLPKSLYDDIRKVAIKIKKILGDFDFNINNIFITDDGKDFKFVDFGIGSCDFESRLNNLRKLFKYVDENSKMTYKNLFRKGWYGGRWNLNFNIKKEDKVLDIGSGDNPYPYATDGIDEDTAEAKNQRSGRSLKTDNLIMHYGKAENILPTFKDKEFDFIYTSHTLEHMDDLPLVLDEMSRVGKRGFVAVPLCYYDLLDNKSTTGHKWFMAYDHTYNRLRIRKRYPYEYADAATVIPTINLGSDTLQSHNTNSCLRSIWEVRFYWENGINYIIDNTLFEESLYINNKFDTTISNAISTQSYIDLQVDAEKDLHYNLEDYGDWGIRTFNLMKKHLPNPNTLSSYPNNLVLDIGCNTGYHTKFLADMYGDAIGIDINEKLIKESKVNHDKCYVCDMHNMKFKPETFDLVFAKDVLEHSHTPHFVLRDCYNILKYGGKIIAYIPMDGMGKFDAVNETHLWKTTYDECKQKFNYAGFRNVTIYKYSYINDLGIPRYISDEVGIIVAEKLNYNTPAKTNRSTSIMLPHTYFHSAAYWAHMITFRCGGNCPFCIVDGRGKHVPRSELSGKEIVDFWNNVQHTSNQRLSLIGGETTLHKDFVEIVNNLEGYQMTVTTNCKGVFYDNNNFDKVLKPKSSSTLRINTSYHPHALSPQRYVEVVKRFEDAGYFVDQKAFVYTPDVIQKYGKEIEEVRKHIPLKSPPFLGFWNEKDGYNAKHIPENLWPHEGYWDQESARVMCGITDYELYRYMCGQEEGRPMKCNHPLVTFLVAPDGYVFGCHYKLYYNIEPMSHIHSKTLIEDLLGMKEKICNFSGLSNFCDIVRLMTTTIRKVE